MTLDTKINANNIFFTNTLDLANINGKFDTSLENLKMRDLVNLKRKF